MQSSSTRRKFTFVPWLAALIIGATVHAAWLIHELREPDPSAPAPIEVAFAISPEIRPRVKPKLQPLDSSAEGCRRPGSVPEVRPRVEPMLQPLHRSAEARRRPKLVPIAAPEDELDLDLWIERVDRYTYQIDRRVLERVALAEYEGQLVSGFGVVARTLGYGKPIELRNIQAGTPLFVLGLRTGDRVHAITTHGSEALERVEVALERRGRPVELVYRLI